MNQWTCKACGESTCSKDGIEQENGVYFVACKKCDAKTKIVQTGGGIGAPTQFSIVSVIPLRVIYSTEAFIAAPKYEAGQLAEAEFPNLEKAKAAALPKGFTFALVDVDGGRWVYEARYGWQFEERG